MTTTTPHLPLVRLADLADDVPLAVRADGVELVVVRHGAQVSVFQGECPHQGTLLGGGAVEGGALVCPGHGWRFDRETGRREGDPAVCLTSFAARVEGDVVAVDAGEVRAWRERRRASTVRAATTDVAGARPLRSLPGPRGLPLVGSLLELDLPRLHAVFEGWADEYGPLYTFRLGRRPVLVVSDPALVHEVLRRRPETYRRLGTIAPVLAEMGADGVFSAEGERWRRQRSVAMHTLDTRHLRTFWPALVETTERLRARWARAAAEGRPVDVPLDLRRYTVDVTTRLAFGYDTHAVERDDDPLLGQLEHVFPTLTRRITAPFPYWHFVRLPADRAFDAALAGIRAAASGFIAESRARLARDPALAARPTNFLEAMLTARAPDGGAAFTEEEIVANALTMLVAGEDTTANTLAWMMHVMAERPDVQRAMRAEADAVLGDSGVLARYGDQDRLPYLDAVTQETMRLKPVAPMLFFEANHATALGGVALEPGGAVFLLARQCALRESAFRAAREFRPERWLRPEAHAPHTPAALVPFGAGPRFCPGRNLALLEIAAVATMVARHFSVEPLHDGPPVGERFAFTMMPTNLRMRLVTLG